MAPPVRLAAVTSIGTCRAPLAATVQRNFPGSAKAIQLHDTLFTQEDAARTPLTDGGWVGGAGTHV